MTCLLHDLGLLMVAYLPEIAQALTMLMAIKGQSSLEAENTLEWE